MAGDLQGPGAWDSDRLRAGVQPPGLERLSVYVRAYDRFGRKVLLERPLVLSPAAVERALHQASTKGLEVWVRPDELGSRGEPATLRIAPSGGRFTLHDAVNGIPATLADVSGQVVEGTLKLMGMSDASARVAGKLARVGLKFLFKPLVAPLKQGVVLLEVASLVGPAGHRGDPEIMGTLVRGWVKDAVNRER